MAKINTSGVNEYITMLNKLSRGVEPIAKEALYDGADVVADAIKASLTQAIASNASGRRARGDKRVNTGGLVDSMFIAKMRNDGGYINTAIGFAGYDKNGTPNALKASALESGTSNGIRKTSFIRNAVNASKDSCINAIKQKFEAEIDKITK